MKISTEKIEKPISAAILRLGLSMFKASPRPCSSGPRVLSGGALGLAVAVADRVQVRVRAAERSVRAGQVEERPALARVPARVRATRQRLRELEHGQRVLEEAVQRAVLARDDQRGHVVEP